VKLPEIEVAEVVSVSFNRKGTDVVARVGMAPELVALVVVKFPLEVAEVQLELLLAQP
jgi:hypothetical protein